MRKTLYRTCKVYIRLFVQPDPEPILLVVITVFLGAMGYCRIYSIVQVTRLFLTKFQFCPAQLARSKINYTCDHSV
jgi:hypothetical protein